MGIVFQYLIGVFILRNEFGFRLFKFLGTKITDFLDFTDNGSKLVFGEKYTDHYFAFKVLYNNKRMYWILEKCMLFLILGDAGFDIF